MTEEEKKKQKKEIHKGMEKDIAKLDTMTKLVEQIAETDGCVGGRAIRKGFQLSVLIDDLIDEVLITKNKELEDKALSIFDQFIKILSDFKEEK